jgi:transcriptional regulator with XRE-family HTH domain
MTDTLGSRLKQVRDSMRISQTRFAELLGVSQFSISNYETGKRFPDLEFLVRLHEITRVNLSWLIVGKSGIDDIIPGAQVDNETREFLYWFEKLPGVRHNALAGLAELKFKYPDRFAGEQEAGENKFTAEK